MCDDPCSLFPRRSLWRRQQALHRALKGESSRSTSSCSWPCRPFFNDGCSVEKDRAETMWMLDMMWQSYRLVRSKGLLLQCYRTLWSDGALYYNSEVRLSQFVIRYAPLSQDFMSENWRSLDKQRVHNPLWSPHLSSLSDNCASPCLSSNRSVVVSL